MTLLQNVPTLPAWLLWSLFSLLFVLALYALHLNGRNLLPGPCVFCALRNWTVRKLFDYIRRKCAENPTLVTKLAAAMGDFSAQFVDGVFDPGSTYRGTAIPGGLIGPFPVAVSPAPPAPAGALLMPPAIEGVGIFTVLPVGPPTMLVLQLLERLDADHRALANLAATAEGKGLKLSTLGSHVHSSRCDTCTMIAQTQEMLSRFGLQPRQNPHIPRVQLSPTPAQEPVAVMCSEVHAVCPTGALRDHVHDPSTCPGCCPAQTSAQEAA
jgi:hypothetical protein